MRKFIVCLCMTALLGLSLCLVVSAANDQRSISINDFTDLQPDAWYMQQGSIAFAIDHHLMQGISDTLFAPDAVMTRAQFATILYRMVDQPSTEAIPNPSFSDFDKNAWWADAMKWATFEGIISGSSDPTGKLSLDADGNVTRLQMITMIYRYADKVCAYDMGNRLLADFSAYADGNQVGYSRAEMMWAITTGYVQGTETNGITLLTPNQGVTRAQAMTVLMRYMQDTHTFATPTDAVIWNFLKSKGFNDYAAAGIMGNLFAESSLRSNNLQNSYETKLGLTDAGYTDAVDGGTYTKDQFVHDSAGYGLAQWTFWSRKEGLYNLSRERKVSICDLQLQLDYLYSEAEFQAIMVEDKKGEKPDLLHAKSVSEASDIVLTRYERPADQSDEVKAKRTEYSMTYYNKFAGK